jgi:O-antigen/teichoic acid export membrane protein
MRPPETAAETTREVPLATRVVRGGLVVALASYATILIGFSANIVMRRLVSPEAFGALAIATFLFGLLNLRAKIGLGQAFIHSPELSGRAIGTVFALDLGAGLVSGLIALIAAPVLILLGYPSDVAWVVLALGMLGLVAAGSSTPGLLMDKELLFGRTTVITAITLALSYAPAFYLAFKGYGVWSLVAQAASQWLLVLIGFWWAARRELKTPWHLHWTFAPTLAKEYVRFGVTWGIADLAGFLTTQFDNFLVGTFVSLTAAGLYTFAYQLALWSSVLVTTIVSRASFPTYAKLQDDRARLSKTFELSLWIITTLALPLALFLFVAAPEIIQLLYTAKWLPAVALLRFLLLASLIRPLLDDLDALLIAIGKPHLVSIAQWTQAAIVIVVAGALTFPYGAEGTAVGVDLAFVVGGLLLYRLASPYLDVRWMRALGLPLAATAVTLLAYFALSAAFNWDALPLVVRLLGKGALVAVVFYALVVALQPRTFLERVQYIWRLARGAG